MNFLYYVKLYLATCVAFFAVDMIWLGLLAKGFYRKYLGYLMRPRPLWPAAILFYMVFVAGILIFCVIPARQHGTLARALLLGALFGFFTYATYDMTNLATIRDWPLKVTVVDIVWGSFLCAVTAGFSFWVSGLFK